MTEFNIDEFNPEQNMYIQASAGTGKTYTIQLIVDKLLSEGPELSLDNILIVTYTEKAAGELRDRIRAKLQETKRFDQLSLVDNAPIYTIHAFCQRTIEEFPFAVNKPAALQLIDDSEINTFIDKWVRDELVKDKTFRKLLYLTHGEIINTLTKQISAGIKKYYLNNDGEEVSEIITLDKIEESEKTDSLTVEEIKEISCIEVKMDKHSKPWACSVKVKDIERILNFSEKKSAESKRTKTEKNSIKILDKKLSDLLEESSDFKTKAVSTERENISAFLEAIRESENSIVNTKLLKAANIYKKLGSGADQYKKYIDEFINKIIDANNTIDTICSDYSQIVFQQQFRKIYLQWITEKEKNKTQSYDDMLRTVREAVCCENSILKKNLQKKYRYAIIDEFQDTNQKQWDVFREVFKNSKDHSIFVVGDPKQSIYSFQGADIKVYESAVEEIGQTGSGNTISTNWRSTKQMIDACNSFFEKKNEELFFADQPFDFFRSKSPSESKGTDKIPPEYYDGKTKKWCETKPVWIPENESKENDGGSEKQYDETDFAKFAVKKIADICSFVDGTHKTKLQVFKKKCTGNKNQFVLDNVNFSDIAILSRTKSEMQQIKYELTKAGIPYSHYKEANLFSGIECAAWITLFKSINADSFTGKKRAVLNEVLFSDFFGIPLWKVEDKKFDEPDCEERMLILKWKKLSSERLWPQLLESIFEETRIEEKFSQLDKLSSLAKYRQIGDYSINYLCNNNCSLQELINHLTLLSRHFETSDNEDGNLVAKGTDFNCVQIMSIHASKGLEFPVVIFNSGFKRLIANSDKIYFYHDEETRQFHASVDNNKKVTEENELNQEVMRLFYVAYTRATSLIISPWFSKKEKGGNPIFPVLENAYKESNIVSATDDGEENTFISREIFDPESTDAKSGYSQSDIRNKVKEIIKHTSGETEFQSDKEEETQKKELENLSGRINSLNVYKLSYSTLSHGKTEKVLINDEISENKEVDEETQKGLSEFDRKNIVCRINYQPSDLTKIIDGYPRGTYIGEAVHTILEVCDFQKTGNSELEKLAEDSYFNNLITSKFRAQGMVIDSQDSKSWRRQTCEIVWNTMNAVLPEIAGNKITGSNFALKDLSMKNHLAEVEFNMNPIIPVNARKMKDYFNGFIDLMFVREFEGEKIYSIADWKTDSFDLPEDYADGDELKKRVDEHYSIQRVLYSYCLILWLKQFYPDRSEEEIFQKNFGGIYYVFVKGCRNNTSNGIYAQTWNCWEDLKKAFEEIVDEKIAERK